MEGKGNKGVLDWAAGVLAAEVKKQGSAIKADLTKGSGPAIAREAVKDVRSTIHQVFFGQAEGVGEPGAPLNPLPSEVAASRTDAGSPYGKGKAGVHGKPLDPTRLPSPAEVAREKQPYQPPSDRGSDNGQQNSKGRE